LIHCQKILIDFYRSPYAVPIPPTPKSFAATGSGGTFGAANFCPDWSDRIFVLAEWTTDRSRVGRSPKPAWILGETINFHQLHPLFTIHFSLYGNISKFFAPRFGRIYRCQSMPRFASQVRLDLSDKLRVSVLGSQDARR
jgi:hypothetical protein